MALLRSLTLPLVACCLIALPACGQDDSSVAAPVGDIPTPLDAADAGEPSDVDPAVDTAAAEEVVTPPTPGLGLDYESTEAGRLPRYELEGEGFTALPWPHDRLRNEDGRPDLFVIPNPGNAILDSYVEYGHEVMEGFGTNGGVYFAFDGALDLDALPDEQTTMHDSKAIVQLVNVSEGSPRYGEQMPLQFDFYTGGEDPYYADNTLSMRPLSGFPLSEGDTYCAIVTRAVVDTLGRYTQLAPEFDATLNSDPTLAPLVSWLAGSMLLREDLAVATCFTTDEPTKGLREIRDFLETRPLAEVAEIGYLGQANYLHEWQGIYVAPNFQAGEKPYEWEGGGFVYDEEGNPTVQLEEDVYFLLMVPSAHKMPENGWPVVIYGHGTGGSHTSCKSSVGQAVLQQGLAMVCIDLPLHGARGDDKYAGDIDRLSFNFVNPRAGRTNFRQAAIDTMSLARMIVGGIFDMPAGETEFEDAVILDPEHIHYFGHSHGGLSGSMHMGIEPLIQSAVLSGSGGVFAETILVRTDPLDFKFLIGSLLDVEPEELDLFHPAMSLMQMLVDATDPINYAPYWMNPGANGRAKHIFLTEGLKDHATPPVTTNSLAAAAGVPQINDVEMESLAHMLRGIEPIDEPVGSNVTNQTGEKLTGGLMQWKNGDHWVAFDHPQARAMWTSFYKAIVFGTPPVISD